MNSGINMKNRTSCPKELCGIFTQTNKEKKSFSSSACPNFAQKEHLLRKQEKDFFLLFHQSGGCHSFSIETTYFCPTIFGWHLIVRHQSKTFFSPNKSSLVVDPKNQLQTECTSKCKTSVEITPLNIL